MIEFLQTGRSSGPGWILEGQERTSFADLDAIARRMAGSLLAQGVGPDSSVYLLAQDSSRLIAAVAAVQYCGATVCVLNRSITLQELESLARRLPPGPLVTDSDPPGDWPGPVLSLDGLESGSSSEAGPPQFPGRLMILTTGTTGTPKPVLYEWPRLLSQVRESNSGSRWALLYPLNHFAGMQVLLHALKCGSSLAIPRSRAFADVRECLIEHQVDSASATPTFWRTFAGRLEPPDAARLNLRQITLGGEPVTADLLDRLRALFPGARLTQVYATTELGSCFAVNDGLAGFPASYLDAPVGNVELKIHEGELFVRTKLGMERYADGTASPRQIGDWIATGDCVEVRDGRVRFLGRVSEIVNVGGVKVSPPVVEQEIRKVAGVRDVRVFGKPNPVTGQIVAAEIELAEGASGDTVLAGIRTACRTTLNRYEQPRELRVVEALRRSNEKLVRA